MQDDLPGQSPPASYQVLSLYLSSRSLQKWRATGWKVTLPYQEENKNSVLQQGLQPQFIQNVPKQVAAPTPTLSRLISLEIMRLMETALLSLLLVSLLPTLRKSHEQINVILSSRPGLKAPFPLPALHSFLIWFSCSHTDTAHSKLIMNTWDM